MRVGGSTCWNGRWSSCAVRRCPDGRDAARPEGRRSPIGEGVVGQQPKLEPGERFEYTSWAMLRTPFGTMRGTYFMVRPDGGRFEARIAEFPLTLPHALH